MAPRALAARRAAPARARRGRWRAPVDARALRARGRLWTLSTAAHSVPFVATAGRARRDRAAAGAGRRRSRSCTRGRSPSSTPTAAPRSCARPRRRDAARRAHRARAARRPRRPRGARAARPHRPGARSAGGSASWLVGEAGALLVRPGGRRVHCWCVRVDDPRCPPPTAPRTCCWRCARTRPASPPWPTSPSAARAGASAAGSRRAMRPALDARARGSARRAASRRADARCRFLDNGPSTWRRRGPSCLP